MGRVGPPKNLVLLRLDAQSVEKFAEAVDQVALGDDDEDREAQVERALNPVELLGDLSGLDFNLVAVSRIRLLAGSPEAGR